MYRTLSELLISAPCGSVSASVCCWNPRGCGGFGKLLDPVLSDLLKEEMYLGFKV